MTPHQTFVARSVLSSAAAVASVIVIGYKQLWSLPMARFERTMQTALVVSRFLIFGLVFLVLRLEPRGDVPVFYFGEAVATLAGMRPYSDFVSSYSPLHPYLDGVILRLWHSPLSLILFAICVEWVVLPLWFRAGRSFLTEAEIRTGTILYVTSAFSLQFVTIDGQDNVVIAVLLVAAIMLLAHNRNVLAGIATGTAVAAVKFLPLIYLPAFFVSTRKRWSWAAGMATVIGVVYGGFALMRIPILEPLAVEGNLRSPGNLPFLLMVLTGRNPAGMIFDGVLMVMLGALFYLLARVSRNAGMAVRLRALTFCLVAVTAAVELFAKKSWPAYMILVLFPAYAMIRVRRTKIIAIAFFTVIALLEHSYWASFLDSMDYPELHRQLMAMTGSVFIYLVFQVLLLIFYGWLLRLSVGEMLAAGSPVRLADEAQPEVFGLILD